MAVRQNQNSLSFSLTNPGKIEFAITESLPYAIDIRFLPGERLHQRQAMENEGDMGLTHRSCFRVAAVPTLATRGATIHRIIFDDLLFLKARRQGRGEGRTSSGTGCTCCGNEKRGPLSMFLTLSVRGGTRTT